MGGGTSSPMSPRGDMESMSSKAPPVKVVRKQRQRIFEKGSYFFDKSSAQENMGEEENFDTGMVIDDVTRELLEGALSGFYFLQSNEGDKSKMDTLIRAMQKEELDKDTLLIVEGESGTKLFVVESGELEVSINGQVIRKMGKGVLLGELALLYDAPRTATVRCTTKCILWSLRREVFKKIQAYSSSDLDLQRSRWLINSHELAVLSALDMSRLIGALHTTHYRASDVLYKEHEPTNQCILIEKGLAKVYVSKDPKGVVVEQVDNMLGITRPQGPSGAQSAGVSSRPNTAPKQPGGYFACDITTGCLLGIGILCGKANLAESWKWVGPEGAEPPCTVIAQNDMTCLSFTVDVFESLFGPVDKVLQPRKRDIEQQNQVQEYCGRKFDSTKFKLKYVLGSGSFGIVTLAEYRENPQTVETFALKSLSKVAVIETGQLRHVLDERRLLGSMNSPFVLKLFGTYQTPHQLVMVTEPLNCGDLWCVIYETSPYSENEGISLALARTYTAILVLGLAHVHEQGVVYRDLKPENIMVDELGYLRIIDFGFAKKVPYTKVDSRGEMRVHPKTYTLCGTPEYLSPELIFNLGHDQSSDLWALGVLIHEMMMATTPFSPKRPDNVTELFTNIAMVKKNGLKLNPKLEEKAGTPAISSLISQLLKADATERLGAGSTRSILAHDLFNGLNIAAINKKTFIPTHIPEPTDYHEPVSNLTPIKPFNGNQALFNEF